MTAEVPTRGGLRAKLPPHDHPLCWATYFVHSILEGANIRIPPGGLRHVEWVAQHILERAQVRADAFQQKRSSPSARLIKTAEDTLRKNYTLELERLRRELGDSVGYLEAWRCSEPQWGASAEREVRQIESEIEKLEARRAALAVPLSPFVNWLDEDMDPVRPTDRDIVDLRLCYQLLLGPRTITQGGPVERFVKAACKAVGWSATPSVSAIKGALGRSKGTLSSLVQLAEAGMLISPTEIEDWNSARKAESINTF